MKRKSFYSHLYFWVLVGMVLGIFVGHFMPQVGIELKPLGDGFIRLIRMMIAPIIFTTVVIGIAGMGNLKRLGRIGVKAVIYFEVMTTLALIIGWTVAKFFQPGSGMNADPAQLDVKDLKPTLA